MNKKTVNELKTVNERKEVLLYRKMYITINNYDHKNNSLKQFVNLKINLFYKFTG